MSDLAPLVAATIRDRVVVNQQKEIEALRNENAEQRQENQRLMRLLHERNPFRSIKLTGPNGEMISLDHGGTIPAVFRERRINVVEPTARHGDFTFFNQDENHLLLLRNLLDMELWVDGAFATRIEDLTFTYSGYGYFLVDFEGWKYEYIATFTMEDGDAGYGLYLPFGLVLPPEEHARLLSRDTCVDFTPPADLDPADQYADEVFSIEIFAEEEVPMSQLRSFSNHNAILDLYDWRCTGNWLLGKLTVPYVPFGDDV